jgi:addiction module HigA family antidote
MPHNFTIPKNRRPVSPGEMLDEEFRKPLGLTQKQLAEALGIDRPALNMIVNGRRRITPETAMRLSIVLGTSADFWLNAQMINDLYEVQHSEAADRLKKRLKPLRKAQSLGRTA